MKSYRPSFDGFVNRCGVHINPAMNYPKIVIPVREAVSQLFIRRLNRQNAVIPAEAGIL
jgi:hypothetical protein